MPTIESEKPIDNKVLDNTAELLEQKAKADKQLLDLEILIAIASIGVLIACLFVALTIPMLTIIKIVLIVIGSVLFLGGMFYAIRIEQVAGYYRCSKCGEYHIPKYWQTFFAPHVFRTRYMRCPYCHKFSWQKKVLK